MKQSGNESNEQQLTIRIENQEKIKLRLNLDDLPEAPLMPFDGSSHTDIHVALPFTQEDYFNLVDETSRMLRDDKGGAHCVGTPEAICIFAGSDLPPN